MTRSAPLIRERFRVSRSALRRARRACSRAGPPTWKGQAADPVLDRVDLAAVGGGPPLDAGPRKDEHVDEPALLAASRETVWREQVREAERRRQSRRRQESKTRAAVASASTGYSCARIAFLASSELAPTLGLPDLFAPHGLAAGLEQGRLV